MLHLLMFSFFQEDAVRQLRSLEKEIQDSMDELEKISPLYDNQVMREKEITKGYVYRYLISKSFISLLFFCFNLLKM